MRKELPQQLLGELLKNSKRSDRELAKILGVSQPTVTRARNRLEQNGTIQDYTIIPNFKEMGFEILAINFAKMRPGLLSIDVAFYKNFTEYLDRVSLMRTEWKDFVEDIQSFVVPIGEGAFKRLSLTYLGDVPI